MYYQSEKIFIFSNVPRYAMPEMDWMRHVCLAPYLDVGISFVWPMIIWILNRSNHEYSY